MRDKEGTGEKGKEEIRGDEEKDKSRKKRLDRERERERERLKKYGKKRKID